VNKSKKIYPIVNLAFKIIIALLSIGYLSYVIFFQKNEYVDPATGEKAILNLSYLSENIASIVSNRPDSILMLSLILLLVFVNWGIEIIKWKLLVGKLLSVSYKLATTSILGGIAASNMTPFRIGGFFARVAQLPLKYRVKGVAIIFLGDTAQLLSTLLFGSFSTLLLVFFLDTDMKDITLYHLQTHSLLAIAGTAFIATITACILFMYLDKLVRYLNIIPFLKNRKTTWNILNTFNFKSNAIALLLLSILRLLTISTQYYLAFKLFGFDLGLIESLLIINTLFLIFNFLPTFNIIEFGITKTAILIFLLKAFISPDFVTLNVALVVSCGSFLIWFVNLAMPSVIGSFFLARIKLFNHQ
jgi:hypothetical protein